MTVAFFSLFVAASGVVGASNDVCGNATGIAGAGVFEFDNTDATADGPPHAACMRGEASSEDIAHDLWYCWTSPCDGTVTVDTCKQTTVDTRLAVYEGCTCPTDDTTLLDCNDEPFSPDDGVCVYQSRVSFQAVTGQSYLLRVGTEPTVGGGEGTFTVTCGEDSEPPCAQIEGHCQTRDSWSAFPSDGATRIVADDFAPQSTGDVSELCWWGAYVEESGDCLPPGTDAFEVTYFADDDGLPGAVLAGPFRQVDGSLTVEGPARTHGRLMDTYREFEYHAMHAPVSVVENLCYWVQIVNALDDSCVWHWEAAATTSTRGVSIQDGTGTVAADGYTAVDMVVGDMAFCLDLPLGLAAGCSSAPLNDACDEALPIDEGLTLFNTAHATTGVIQPYSPSSCYNPDDVCCSPIDDNHIYRDIWFTHSPSCDGLLRIEMCDSLYDAKVAVFTPDFDCSLYDRWIACSDDACGGGLGLQPQIELIVRAGFVYHFQVGGYRSFELDLLYNESDCFDVHPPEAGGGCDDVACAAAVCGFDGFGDPSCCDSEWNDYCTELALMRCTGHGGPGSLFIELQALPPEHESLRSYADFLTCFSGSCSAGSCDTPIYPETCCLGSDYDSDGDVDVNDFDVFRQAITGP